MACHVQNKVRNGGGQGGRVPIGFYIAKYIKILCPADWRLTATSFIYLFSHQYRDKATAVKADSKIEYKWHRLINRN
jgi:hypothetical protein